MVLEYASSYFEQEARNRRVTLGQSCTHLPPAPLAVVLVRDASPPHASIGGEDVATCPCILLQRTTEEIYRVVRNWLGRRGVSSCRRCGCCAGVSD